MTPESRGVRPTYRELQGTAPEGPPGPAWRGFGPALLLSLLVLGAGADPARGQLAQLLRAVGDGGSWVNLTIEAGRGAYRSAVLPVAGLALDGCFQVWEGHSGSWTVRADDTQGDGKVDVTAPPGEAVEFRYKAGLQAQLDVTVEWSEPRDTTLFLWVGLAVLASGAEDRNICQPP